MMARSLLLGMMSFLSSTSVLWAGEPAATTLTISAPTSSIAIQFFRVEVSVSSAIGPPPPGTPVTVVGDIGNECIAELNSSGVGGCEMVSLNVGSHPLRASFAGTTLLLGSSQSRTHTVLASPNPPLNTALDLRSIGVVEAMVRLSDGSVVIAGGFDRIGSVARRTLAKLQPNGALDPTFNPSVYGTVNALAVDANDHIFVRGWFGFIGNTERLNIAKLSPDGTVLTDWTADAEIALGFGPMVVDSAGDVLVDGGLRSVGANGGVIPMFKLSGNTGAQIGAAVAEIAVAANELASFQDLIIANDGIYIAGRFNRVNGAERRNLARLNMDGSLDSSWDPSPNGEVFALSHDGNALFVSGQFFQIGGQSANGLAKLNATGAPILSFAPALSAPVWRMLNDGSSLIGIGGEFDSSGYSNTFVVKLDANSGATDPAFAVTTNASLNSYGIKRPLTAMVRSGATIYFGGNFNVVNGTEHIGIASVSALNGSALSVPIATRPPRIRALARDANGATLIGGSFLRPGTSARNLVRLSANGEIDTAFNPAPDGNVVALATSANGDSYAAGAFTRIGGLERIGLARINASGEINAAFNANVPDPISRAALQVLPDGLVIWWRIQTDRRCVSWPFGQS